VTFVKSQVALQEKISDTWKKNKKHGRIEVTITSIRGNYHLINDSLVLQMIFQTTLIFIREEVFD
jgi:hypothetical protein